jgi:hypothetical protein
VTSVAIKITSVNFLMNCFQDVEETGQILRKFVVDTPSNNVVLVRKKSFLFKGNLKLLISFKLATCKLVACCFKSFVPVRNKIG